MSWPIACVTIVVVIAVAALLALWMRYVHESEPIEITTDEQE